ncbi:MAG: exonuclease domain-containing protein [Magnetococcus sp. WYHC-3]
MSIRGWWMDWRRRRLLARSGTNPLGQYLSREFPHPSRPLSEVEFLAVDLETTALNPAQGEMVSVGWVPIIGGGICLSQARHVLMRPRRGVSDQSAVVHGLTEEQLAHAAPREAVLPELLQHLAGRVLLCHFARIETSFLSAACRELYGQPLLVPVVDTLALALRAQDRRGLAPVPGELRLAALRQALGLPRYPAHHALMDAVATAELFLAQAARIGGHGEPTLAELG